MTDIVANEIEFISTSNRGDELEMAQPIKHSGKLPGDLEEVKDDDLPF